MEIKNFSAGYTLVEILIVLVLIGILAGFGFNVFTSYANKQLLDQTALNIKTTIEKAKFNAISKVKPSSGCTTLLAYDFSIPSSASNKYVQAIPVCDNGVGSVDVNPNPMVFTQMLSVNTQVKNSNRGCYARFSVLDASITFEPTNLCQNTSNPPPQICTDQPFCVVITGTGGVSGFRKIKMDPGGNVWITNS